VATAFGTVAYRKLGQGSPLVLIMGFASSQDLWPPGLVASLAQHHQVITFDNAGIGGTAPVPGVLSIASMAEQTDALIHALDLRRPDVMGWSMGGMIAQALAGLHPEDVHRLVLASTNLGNGTAPITPALLAFGTATALHDSAAVYAGLFPADQVEVGKVAVDAAVHARPTFTTASPAVDAAQMAAIKAWDAGRDPAGHLQLHLPTLIGDGQDDVLIPIGDSIALHEALSGSILVTYPDASHAFVFQDEAAWADEVQRFLGASG
jgi:pimeloyl-ACP methyl ester carboxylesterase